MTNIDHKLDEVLNNLNIVLFVYLNSQIVEELGDIKPELNYFDELKT